MLNIPDNRFLQACEFIVNVQHDCAARKCALTGTRVILQERMDTGLTERAIKHNDDNNFVLNIHALHNAHRVRRIVSSKVIGCQTVPSEEERLVSHCTALAKLTASRKQKEAAKDTTGAQPVGVPDMQPSSSRAEDSNGGRHGDAAAAINIEEQNTWEMSVDNELTARFMETMEETGSQMDVTE